MIDTFLRDYKYGETITSTYIHMIDTLRLKQNKILHS